MIEKDLRELEKWGPEVRRKLAEADKLLRDAEDAEDEWDVPWKKIRGALERAEFGLKKQEVAYGRVGKYLKDKNSDIRDLAREM